ncbi:SRPBCC family protein [Antarcticirhabdus aurantiaca]|uniref:SRPBCC family protein n=1 Tax=Antarcticirhabdus aurantiaca TaxID=2606717 RepID=A0ACD4NK83_9HYPH|nr:SRPBCC family protein [Antarcticirhabdus aurantiaca]WAJ27288.1 SRPBCC family protein [Jeongeuplla avenae]
MVARFLGALVALLLLPSLAFAHGPTRQKHTETIEIAAPPEAVWAKLGTFGDMSWHPRIAMTDAPSGSAPGSKRVLGFSSGGLMEEELSKYDPAKMSFSTFIGQVNVELLPATNYSSTVTVKPGAAPGTSIVEWRAAFYRGYPNNDPPPELNDEAAVAGVSAFMKEGLANLKTVVEAGA